MMMVRNTARNNRMQSGMCGSNTKGQLDKLIQKRILKAEEDRA